MSDTPFLTCILGLLDVNLSPFAQSATVWTHLFTISVSDNISLSKTNLVCGVQDRLVLDAFDTQHDF